MNESNQSDELEDDISDDDLEEFAPEPMPAKPAKRFDIRALRLWREGEFDKFRIPDARRALIAFQHMAKRRLRSHPHLLRVIESNNAPPEYCFAVYMALHNAPIDLRGTWAALTSTGDGGRIMHLCLQACRDEISQNEKVAEVLSQEEPEDSLGSIQPSHLQRVFARIPETEAEDLATTLTEAVRIARDDRHKPTTSDALTLRVLEAIGDPKGSQGRDVRANYEALTEPLPLRGAEVVQNHDSVGGALRLEFPWLEAAITRVVDELALMAYTGRPWFRLQPLLLVGPPGSGKTRFAQRLAQLAKVGFGSIAVAGSMDNRNLMGTARGWSSTQPALPLLTMKESNCANPLCLVDEVEKGVVDSRNGSVVNALHTFLEPQSAARFHDECLLASCDLSQVSWILTANSLTGLPDSLMSRLSVVKVETPRPADFDAVYHSILRDLAGEWDCSPEELPEIHPDAQDDLRSGFVRQGDVRRLKLAMRRAIAAVTRLAPRVLQ